MESKKISRRLNRRKALLTPDSGTTVLINYSEATKTLEVEFSNENKVYHYWEVPPEIWEEYREWVLEKKSSGWFVNKRIKGNYDEKRIE